MATCCSADTLYEEMKDRDASGIDQDKDIYKQSSDRNVIIDNLFDDEDLFNELSLYDFIISQYKTENKPKDNYHYKPKNLYRHFENAAN